MSKTDELISKLEDINDSIRTINNDSFITLDTRISEINRLTANLSSKISSLKEQIKKEETAVMNEDIEKWANSIEKIEDEMPGTLKLHIQKKIECRIEGAKAMRDGIIPAFGNTVKDEDKKQKFCDELESILMGVRLKNYKTDDGDSFPLLDFLSSQIDNTISSGKEEIYNIVEQIYFRINELSIFSSTPDIKQGEKEKEENEQKYIRMSRVFYFVVMHKTDCYRAFKVSIDHEGYKSPEGQKLIALARQEIGYSDKTWSGDIYSSICNTYKSIVVDGVNEPEQIPDLDCGIYREKQSLPYPNPISKHQTDINIGWVRAMKYMGKNSSNMHEFVISEIQKGIVHPNPLTPSEMRVLNLCCKYHESHPVKEITDVNDNDILITLNKDDLDESFLAPNRMYEFCIKHKIDIKEPRDSKGLFSCFIITLKTEKDKILFSGKYIDTLKKIAGKIKVYEITDKEIQSEAWRLKAEEQSFTEGAKWMRNKMNS